MSIFAVLSSVVSRAIAALMGRNLAKKSPLIVIVGPTASGKSALAVELAEQFNGEIICADSRTIYRGMDIGTAKPSADEQARVPHWGLDLVEPGERFTAADFKDYADKKILEIQSRGKVPFLVGGTGLYVDAVVFDYKFASVDLELRAELNKMTLEELQERCKNDSIKLPENVKNKRHLVNAIMRGVNEQQSKHKLLPNIFVVGITTDKEELRERIQARAEQLFDDGVVEEAKMLGKKYGWNSEAMTGNAYPLIKKYLDGEISESELHQKYVVTDWRLAKRQITFMKRNEYIKWLNRDEIRAYLTNILSNVVK